MTNRLRDLLENSDRVVLGMFVTLRNPAIVEMAGLAGLDFVLLDLEHTGLNEADVEDMARAGKGVGVSTVVRVRDQQPEAIGRVMEAGIEGLLIPQIDNADEARVAVNAAYYPPRGTRGMSSLSRAAGWAFGRQQPDPVCAVQIESRAAVENIESILEVPRVDIAFIGPSDLRSSLLPEDGSQDGVDAALQAAIERVVTKVTERDRPYLGIAATHPAMKWDLAACKSRGGRFATLGADVSILAGGLKAMIAPYQQ